jgi:hypothetical protein
MPIFDISITDTFFRNINNNDFRFIHGHQFAYLSDLGTLYLGSNEIDYIPDEAFINCTSLSYLYVLEICNNI